MNQLTIPAILASIILVAGIFAFMPVERATTVHTTIIDFSSGITSISDSTAITSNQGATVTQTYTYTSTEAITVIAIEVTGDISAFTDAGDIVQVSVVTLDGFDLDSGGALPLEVSVGGGAADTINVFLEIFDSNAMGAENISGFVVTPNTAGLAVSVDVIELNSNDANTAISITVTFYTDGPGSTAENIAVA